MPDTHSLSILYVEDNAGLQALLARKMQRAGHQVFAVATINDALKTLEDEKIDIVLSDYNLGGETGLDLLVELSGRKGAPPAVMLTGSGNEEKAVASLKAGARDYLIKDIDGRYFDLLPTVLANAVKNNNQRIAKERAEKELIQSGALLMAQQNAVESGLLGIDREGRIISYNCNLLTLFGLDYDQIEGKTEKDLFALIAPFLTHPGHYLRLVKQIHKDPECSRVNDVIELKDGCIFSRNTSPIMEEGGETIGRMWEFRDVTESERQKRKLDLTQFSIDTLSVPVFWIKPDGYFDYVNHAAVTSLGYGPEEFLGMRVSDISPTMTNAIWAAHWEELKEKKVLQLTTEHRVRTGRVYPVEITASYVKYGQKEYNIAFAHDITERKKAEESLSLASRVFEAASEGVVVTDLDARIISVNPAFTTITGYDEKVVIGRQINILKSDRHEKSFYAAIWEALLTNGAWRGEIWNRRKNGEAYPQSTTITAIKDGSGKTTQYASVFHDITALKQNEEEIKYKAYHDPLTGLPNRQLFYDRLERGKTRAARNGKKLALLYVDLDAFKPINDTLGHAVGDLTLRGVAIRLTEGAREQDTLSRLGGDEFTVIMEELETEKDVAVVAQRIVSSLAEPFCYKGNDLVISASVGCAIYPDDGTSIEELTHNADTAMYHAKQGGKNRYAFFRDSMTDASLKRQKLQKQLVTAIQERVIEVYYQPKVELESGRLIGLEALARWPQPEGGFIPPDIFVPLAEESGLITALDSLVRKKVCSFLAERHTRGESVVPVSLNLSAHDLARNDIVERIESAVTAAGLTPELFEIEVTETSVIDDANAAVERLGQFRAKGFSVAIDDFGTGYSSLNYLALFPLTTLKLDKSFVFKMFSAPNALAVAKAIIVMGHEVGARVVAEGVETQEQRAALQNLGCDYGQGYFFSRPLPETEIATLMENATEGNALSLLFPVE